LAVNAVPGDTRRMVSLKVRFCLLAFSMFIYQ